MLRDVNAENCRPAEHPISLITANGSTEANEVSDVKLSALPDTVQPCVLDQLCETCGFEPLPVDESSSVKVQPNAGRDSWSDACASSMSSESLNRWRVSSVLLNLLDVLGFIEQVLAKQESPNLCPRRTVFNRNASNQLLHFGWSTPALSEDAHVRHWQRRQLLIGHVLWVDQANSQKPWDHHGYSQGVICPLDAPDRKMPHRRHIDLPHMCSPCWLRDGVCPWPPLSRMLQWRWVLWHPLLHATELGTLRKHWTCLSTKSALGPWKHQSKIKPTPDSQIAKKRKADEDAKKLVKPAPRKRKPHRRLVLQRSLARATISKGCSRIFSGNRTAEDCEGDLMPVNLGAGTETTMVHAVNGQSGRDVGGTEMRLTVDGFSGASRLSSSCEVCRMWLGKLPSPTAATGFSSLSFYKRTCIYSTYM